MIQVTTTDVEEKEAAMNMISVLIEELPEYLDKYVEAFSAIVLHVLTRSGIEALRNTAALSLKGLMRSVKHSKQAAATPDYIPSVVKTFLESLYKAITDESDPEPLTHEVTAMREVIEEGGRCLEGPALLKIFESALKLFEDSNKRKIFNRSLKDAENAEEDDIEYSKEENDKENDLQLEIAQLIGSLFKSHPDEAVHFVPLLYPRLLGEMLKPEASEHQRQFGLFIIIDFTEHLGYSRLPTLYPEFVEFILSHSQSLHAGIRQACLYGIGAIAKSAGEYFPKVATRCCQALTTALETKAPSGVDKHLWKAARDNGISSLGKLIQQQGKGFADLSALVALWLKSLPLKADLEEGLIQNTLLANMIVNECATVLGPNASNLEHVFRIFVEIADSEQVNDEANLKISKALNFLAGLPELKGKLAEVGATLTSEARDTLEKYLKLSQQPAS